MNIKTIFDFVLNSGIQACIEGAVVFLVVKMTNKVFLSEFKIFLWIIFIVKIFFPYGPESKFSIFNSQFIYNGNNLKEIFLDNAEIPANIEIMNISIFPYIWFFGVVIIGLWILLSDIIFILRVKLYHKPVSERVNKIFNDCREKLNIKKKISLINQSFVKNTSLFGLINPKILIADKFELLKDREIEYIFYHELSHYKRKDIFINYLLIYIQIIHWFNPFIHFFIRCIREEMELCADENALFYIDKSEYKNYGLLLISILEEYSETFNLKLLSVVNCKNQIKRRIKRISDYNDKGKCSRIWLIVLVTLLSFVTLTTGVCKEPVYYIIENINDLEKNVQKSYSDIIPKTEDVNEKNIAVINNSSASVNESETLEVYEKETNNSDSNPLYESIKEPEATVKSLLPGTDLNMMLNNILSTGKIKSSSSNVDLKNYCTLREFEIKDNDSISLGTYIPDVNGNISFYINSDTDKRLNVMLFKNKEMIINANVKPSKTNLYIFKELYENENYELVLIFKTNDQYINSDVCGSVLIY